MKNQTSSGKPVLPRRLNPARCELFLMLFVQGESRTGSRTNRLRRLSGSRF